MRRRRRRVIEDSPSDPAINLADEGNGALIIIDSDEEEEFDAPAILPTQAVAPAAPAAPAPAEADASDEAGNACTICLELMADAGEHRPAALRCGHIFGHDCILRWLASRRPGKCPQCNQSARPNDVTLLYNLPKLAGTVVVAAAAASGAGDGGGGSSSRRGRPGSSSSSSQHLERQLQEERRRREQAEARLQAIARDLEQQRRLLERPQLHPHGRPPHFHQQQQPLLHEQHQYGRHHHHSGGSSRRPDGPPYERHPSHSRQDQQRHHPYRRNSSGGAGYQGPAAAVEWQMYPPPPPPPPPRSAGHGEQQQAEQQEGRPGPTPARDEQRPLAAAAAAAAAEARAAAAAAAAAAPAAAAAAGAAATAAAATTPPPPPVAAAVSQPGTGAGQATPALEMDVAQQASQARRQQQQQQQPLLALLPVQRSSAAAGSSNTSSGPPRRQLPGSFTPLQNFTLSCGSRSFLLDVPGTQLLAAEQCSGGPGSASSSRLRRISLLCPQVSSYIPLHPGCGVVRCLAGQPLLQQQAGGDEAGACKTVAVATERAGLLVASLASNNIIQSIPLKLPVWSAAWSCSNSMQLVLGLDKGRAALADLRMTGDRAILAIAGSSSGSSSDTGSGGFASPVSNSQQQQQQQQQQQRPNMPLHSLVALDGGQDHGQRAADALVACTGGVYAWSSAAPDAFQLVLPSKAHGGTCESLAAAAAPGPDGSGGPLVAASFRAPLATAAAGAGAGFLPSSPVPAHVLARVRCLLPGSQQPGNSWLQEQAAGQAAAGGPTQQQQQPGLGDAALAAAVLSGQQQLMQQTLQLTGHSSQRVMTRSCFLPAPQLTAGCWPWEDEQAVLLSADEQSCCPALWGCSSGSVLVPQQPWQPLAQPLLQLTAGYSPCLGSLLLGALCEQQLVLYAWEEDC